MESFRTWPSADVQPALAERPLFPGEQTFCTENANRCPVYSYDLNPSMLAGEALSTAGDGKVGESLLGARLFVLYGRDVYSVRRGCSMNILKAWFEAPFRLILLVMAIYKANTARVARLMGHVQARQVFNAAILVTVGLWLVIFVFLGDERRSDLSRAVQEWLPFSGE
jgi:hypothetical protein